LKTPKINSFSKNIFLISFLHKILPVTKSLVLTWPLIFSPVDFRPGYFKDYSWKKTRLHHILRKKENSKSPDFYDKFHLHS